MIAEDVGFILSLPYCELPIFFLPLSSTFFLSVVLAYVLLCLKDLEGAAASWSVPCCQAGIMAVLFSLQYLLVVTNVHVEHSPSASFYLLESSQVCCEGAASQKGTVQCYTPETWEGGGGKVPLVCSEDTLGRIQQKQWFSSVTLLASAGWRFSARGYLNLLQYRQAFDGKRTRDGQSCLQDQKFNIGRAERVLFLFFSLFLKLNKPWCAE